MIDHDIFLKRRQSLIEKMIPNSIAILPAAYEMKYSNDTDHRYRQDSDLYYLTAFPEPGSCAVISSDPKDVPFTLFVRPRNKEMETWNGRRYGTAGALETFKCDEAFTIDEIDEKLDKFFENKEAIYTFPGRYSNWDKKILKLWQKNKFKWRDAIDAPKQLFDLSHILHEMRLKKSDYEIDIMRESCRIAAEAHELVMRVVRPGMNERDIEALLFNYFRSSGAYGTSYPSIVASGPNACILHYTENERDISDNDLVLVDAACEYKMYASDITRTFPASGKFTPEQKAVYEIVLDANKQCADAVNINNTPDDVQQLAIKLLTIGLIDLNVLKISLDEAIDKQIYKKFYMHRIGHWLGIDTHDVGSSRTSKGWRKFEPGMVITIEPGIYIAEDDDYFPENFRGIGVRIEDNIHVTNSGPENLTYMCPKEIYNLEELIGSEHKETLTS